MFAEPGASENLKYTFLVVYKYNGHNGPMKISRRNQAQLSAELLPMSRVHLITLYRLVDTHSLLPGRRHNIDNSLLSCLLLIGLSSLDCDVSL